MQNGDKLSAFCQRNIELDRRDGFWVFSYTNYLKQGFFKKNYVYSLKYVSVLKSYERLHENVGNIFCLRNPLPAINTEKLMLHIN